MQSLFLRYIIVSLNVKTTGPVENQGSRKSKIGWELTKSGCHVRSPEFKNFHIFVVFKLIISNAIVFMNFWGAFRPIWLATFVPGSSFWLVTLISEAILIG